VTSAGERVELVVDEAGSIERETVLPVNYAAHYMAAADDSGRVYYPAPSGSMAVVADDGSIAWEGLGTSDEPVIGADGTVYGVGGLSASAWAPDGASLWTTPLEGGSWVHRAALLSDGTLWVTKGRWLYRLSATTGALLETVELTEQVLSPLAVAPDGTLYLMTDRNVLLAIEGPAPLDPDAPWPIWRRDNRRTASVPRP
jgi:outer membrane protein assembly factor BamB